MAEAFGEQFIYQPNTYIMAKYIYLDFKNNAIDTKI